MNWKPAISIFLLAIFGFIIVKNWSIISRKLGLKSSSDISEEEVLSRLNPMLAKAGFQSLPDSLLIAAFKEERLLEVYGFRNGQWILLSQYPFTAMSGTIGPKLKEGDRQIPEGIYTIEYLNPNSSYHLSMKVNYPNEFDTKMAARTGRTRLGYDIFIHGEDRTIGCIPIGNRAIEELFHLVDHVHSTSQTKVIIAPRDFRQNAQYPIISAIDWSEELYDSIAQELKAISDKE